MKTKLLAAFAAASVLALAGCSGGDEVGDVSLGLFTLKDIKINTFQDPKVPAMSQALRPTSRLRTRPTAQSPAARRAKSRPR